MNKQVQLFDNLTQESRNNYKMGTRNKTLTCSQKEIENFGKDLISIEKNCTQEDVEDKLIYGNILELQTLCQ